MIRIGTRASSLALWQARYVQRLLQEQWHELETELVPMTTTGDRVLDRPLAEIGGKGLFVKEIEQAMLAGEIDVAVHSLKDMPTEQPPGLVLDVVVARGPAFDVLCGRGTAWTLETLPTGARVGTGSRRREAQLRAFREDLVIVPIRGNVQTRLDRRERDGLHAVVLAEAGVSRLGIWEDGFTRIPADRMLPAPGQGALVIQRRSSDRLAARWLAPLHCPETDLAVSAERACLRAIGGDCHTPFAAWGRFDDEGFVLTARLFDGARSAEVERRHAEPFSRMLLSEAVALGEAAGRELLELLRA